MNPSNPHIPSPGPDTSPSPLNPQGAHEDLTQEDLNFLRTTRYLYQGARPEFLQSLHAQVDVWAERETLESAVSGEPTSWSSVPTSSRSGRFLRQAVAVYMGVAAALVAYALLRGTDSFTMKEPAKQAVAAPVRGR